MSDSFRLQGRSVLILGGRGYLGREFSRAFVAAGARVCAADRSPVPPAGEDDVSHVIVDVASEAGVAEVVAAAARDMGRLDVMVYAVTAKPRDFYKPLEECSLEGWQTIMRAELDGLFLACREAGRAMAPAGGSIVLLSSIYGVVGNDQRIYEGANLAEVYGGASERPARTYSHAGYAAAKGGVVSMTRFLAAYWGTAGIRVNCISAGGVRHEDENEQFVRRYSERVPMGRKARPEEIADAVLFLASDRSSYMTGHNLVVDGGWSIW
jgi:NAD(P)-dependent dehydrogenase (short-subunit alcohol dehydrogenase family)